MTLTELYNELNRVFSSTRPENCPEHHWHKHLAQSEKYLRQAHADTEEKRALCDGFCAWGRGVGEKPARPVEVST